MTVDADHAELRWVAIALVVTIVVYAAQFTAGVIREAISDEPSYLAKVETCLIERSTPFEPVVGDPIALSAERGALRTIVQGNPVTVALGGSEKDAERMIRAYEAVAAEEVVRTRLEQNRKVVLLWDIAPSASQREFMRLCALDAQQ